MENKNPFKNLITSSILDTALIKLEDCKSIRQVEHRSGYCYGVAKALYEQGHLTSKEYGAYQEQVLYIIKCFSGKFAKDENETER